MLNTLKRIAIGSAIVVALSLAFFGASQAHATMRAHAAGGPHPVENCNRFGSFTNKSYGSVVPGHDMSIQAIVQDAYNSFGDVCAQRGEAIVTIYNSGGAGYLDNEWAGGAEHNKGNVYSSNNYFTYYLLYTCGNDVATFTPFGYSKVQSTAPYTC